MSKEPQKPVSAKPAAPVETLEDAVYRTSLSAGNEAIQRGNPKVTIPTTVLMYGLCAFVAVQLAKQTDAGKKVIKSVDAEVVETKKEATSDVVDPGIDYGLGIGLHTEDDDGGGF